jgi:hypothetical protein
MIYLIQYDRSSGKLIQLLDYTSDKREQAEDARLQLELSLLKKRVPYEVVLLEARNQEELRKTHRRYFEGLEELVSQAPSTNRP